MAQKGGLDAGMEDLRYRQEVLQTQQETFQADLRSLPRDTTARLDRIEAIQQTQAGLITNVALQLQEAGRRIDKLAVKVDKLADLQ
ncbi:MAG: hypothetical protein AAB403_21880 [Planctomycetota bacterium]